jgi:hypothetical protein
MIVYFTKSLLIPDLPLHRRKQKNEWRTIYDLKNTNDTQWAQFKTLSATHLSHQEKDHFFPISSTLHPDVITLNYKWAIFRKSTVAAANEAIPTKKISPYLSDRSGEQYQLKSIKACLNTINQTYSLLNRICFPLIDRSSLQQLQFEWFSKPELNKRSLLIAICKNLKIDIDHDSIPSIVSRHNPAFHDVRNFVLDIRKRLNTERILLEKDHITKRIEHFEQERCVNYASDKAAFISSALSRTKRSIVLDRAIIRLPNGEYTLTTDPDSVKAEASKHFQMIAGAPPATPITIDNIPQS